LYASRIGKFSAPLQQWRSGFALAGMVEEMIVGIIEEIVTGPILGTIAGMM
jgi:hypothetical protein